MYSLWDLTSRSKTQHCPSEAWTLGWGGVNSALRPVKTLGDSPSLSFHDLRHCMFITDTPHYFSYAIIIFWTRGSWVQGLCTAYTSVCLTFYLSTGWTSLSISLFTNVSRSENSSCIFKNCYLCDNRYSKVENVQTIRKIISVRPRALN